MNYLINNTAFEYYCTVKGFARFNAKIYPVSSTSNGHELLSAMARAAQNSHENHQLTVAYPESGHELYCETAGACKNGHGNNHLTAACPESGHQLFQLTQEAAQNGHGNRHTTSACHPAIYSNHPTPLAPIAILSR
jgi:hypothetical protein